MSLYVKVPCDSNLPCEIVDLPFDNKDPLEFLHFLDACYSAIDCSRFEIQCFDKSITEIIGFNGTIVLDDDGKLKGDFKSRFNPRATVLLCGLTTSPFDFICGDILVALCISPSEKLYPLNESQASAVLDFLNRLHFAKV